MKQDIIYSETLLDWSEFYALASQGYDCNDELRFRLASRLISLGCADEVYEIALKFEDMRLCSHFVQRALSDGIIFNLDQLTDLSYCVDIDTSILLIKSCDRPLAYDELTRFKEEFYIDLL
ncbi:MAG: hypothetical protein LBN22_03780 [Clostridiales Family XIII bacterium]|jgi:hypothetical protein|nr:hypothetical protein [Clostridiales Family XIII bacterium]